MPRTRLALKLVLVIFVLAGILSLLRGAREAYKDWSFLRAARLYSESDRPARTVRPSSPASSPIPTPAP